MFVFFFLCFFLFGWRRSTIIKYSPSYAGGRFVGFLEIQIHAPRLSYRNNTFILCLFVAIVVLSHHHFLQQQQEKNDENIKCLQRKREKAKEAGPSSDVYMLRYHVFLTMFFLTLSSFAVCQESVLDLLHPCFQIFQKVLNHEAAFWIIKKLGSNVATTIGVDSMCLLCLFVRQ